MTGRLKNRTDEILRRAGKSLMIALMLGFATVAAQAQSTDRDNPTQLRSNEITGEFHQDDPEYFYSFVTDPGELVFTLDLTAKNYGGAFYVTLFDNNGRQIEAFDQLVTKGRSERVVKRALFAKQQYVVMRLYSGNGEGYFRLRVEAAEARTGAPSPNSPAGTPGQSPYPDSGANSYPNGGTNPYPNSGATPAGGTNQYPGGSAIPSGGANPYPNTNSSGNANQYPNNGANPYPNSGANSYPNGNASSGSVGNANPYPNGNANPYPNGNASPYPNSGANQYPGSTSGQPQSSGEDEPSTDRNNPTPLRTNEITGEFHQDDPEYFYGFFAERGTFTFTLDLTAKNYGGALYITLFDQNGRELYAFDKLVTRGQSERLVKSVTFAKRQFVVMRIFSGNGEGYYRLGIQQGGLSGALDQLGDASLNDIYEGLKALIKGGKDRRQ